jgi:hypothetical protein
LRAKIVPACEREPSNAGARGIESAWASRTLTYRLLSRYRSS